MNESRFLPNLFALAHGDAVDTLLLGLISTLPFRKLADQSYHSRLSLTL